MRALRYCGLSLFDAILAIKNRRKSDRMERDEATVPSGIGL